MGIFRTTISLIFAPFTMSYKPFRKFFRKRNKVSKFFIVLILFYAIAQWLILVIYIFGTVLVLNLGVLWIQALLMFVHSVLSTGSKGISRSKSKLGKRKKKPPAGKKPRGGRKARKNKSRAKSRS